MNKIIILILCLCCAFMVARAEEGPALNPSDANIVGHVVDRKTGEHLSFITIFLKGTTIGTSTDGTGHYYLKNQESNRRFRIACFLSPVSHI